MWRFAIAALQAENVRDEAEWTQSPFSQMLQGRDLLPRGRTTYGTPRAGRERFACVRLFLHVQGARHRCEMPGHAGWGRQPGMAFESADKVEGA